MPARANHAQLGAHATRVQAHEAELCHEGQRQAGRKRDSPRKRNPSTSTPEKVHEQGNRSWQKNRRVTQVSYGFDHVLVPRHAELLASYVGQLKWQLIAFGKAARSIGRLAGPEIPT